MLNVLRRSVEIATLSGHSFFEVGGHSILVMRLVAEIKDVLDASLPLRAVFDKPTAAPVLTVR